MLVPFCVLMSSVGLRVPQDLFDSLLLVGLVLVVVEAVASSVPLAGKNVERVGDDVMLQRVNVLILRNTRSRIEARSAE